MLTTPILKRSLGENDVKFHLMTSSKIYQRKVEINYFIDVWLIIFIILGRPSKGEYSGLSNAEECKLYRSEGSEQKKKNDALRKK